MGTNQANDAGAGILSPLEIDAIGEVMNISMGSAATAVSQMLDKVVEITTPTVGVQPLQDTKYEKLEPALMVKIVYTVGLTGSNVMVFRQHDMQMILNTLMGIPDPPSDDFVFDELSISAACEVMNQMMGSSATALAEFLTKKVDISPPTATVMNEENTFIDSVGLPPESDVVTITFRLTIKDMLDSEFISVMSVDLVKNIISKFIDKDGGMKSLDVEEDAPTATIVAASAQPAPPAPYPQQPAAPYPQQPAAPYPQQPAAPYPQQPAAPYPQQPAAPYPQQPAYPQYAPSAFAPVQNPIDVHPVEFPEFAYNPAMEGAPVMGTNMDLIMNVPLDVSIEIGTTKRKIRDIMSFTSGTVVELDKQAGAPVDVVVNGQLIAHGDVVVIDDNFGVRITEIVGTKDLLSSLGTQQP